MVYIQDSLNRVSGRYRQYDDVISIAFLAVKIENAHFFIVWLAKQLFGIVIEVCAIN